MGRFHQRRTKLARAVRVSGCDAILVTDFTNVTYLTGFTGDDSYLLVGPDVELIVSDSRYSEQLEEECPGLDIVQRPPGASIVPTVARAIKQAHVSRLAVESQSMTLALRDSLAAELPQVALMPSEGLVQQMREIKDRAEITEIRQAVELAEKAFQVVRATLVPGQSEREIAFELENQIRRFGGAGCGFPPIVAVGAHAALPHARPGEQLVSNGKLLLIDWGATARLYRSDLTRVLVTGKISPKFQRIYEVVRKAQQKAIDAIRPGAMVNQIDAAARKVIAQAGYGKQFGHGLGHGFGLEIHEPPWLTGDVTRNRPLRAGMVVTVEPGIYLPGQGGVRIEDDILVTRDGHEVLSHLPKQLEDCIVP